MITQTYQIDMIPSGEPVVVHVSQYDTEGRTLAFDLYNGGVKYNVPVGSTASISGTKPDGTGFAYAMTVSGNTCSIDIPQQVALIAGDVIAEIRLTDDDAIIGSANFIIRVERSALDEDTAISQTDVPIFEQLVQDAQAAATTAGTKASDASGYATAANDAKVAAQAAQASTEALFPAGGTAGQYLEKTQSGTQWSTVQALPAGGTAGQVLTKNSSTEGDAGWANPTGSGGNLVITVSYADSTYTADKTFAQIEANIADGGFPYVVYNTMIFWLHAYTSGTSATFIYENNNGGYYSFRINSSGVTYSANGAYLEFTRTLEAASWSSGVQTISSTSIPAPENGSVTISMPNASTKANLEIAVAAFRAADLHPFNQASGSIQIAALGTVPTSDMDVVITVTKRY